ncbi:MAG: 50S ribosomal protein L9 [Flavobacteriales bacterium]
MQVILKKDMQPLGFQDDVVTVKPGYGRNYLIPQGYAVLATDSAKKVHAENVKQRAKKDEKAKADANQLAAKLQALTVKVGAKAGETGKIFGSVINVQVGDALKAQGVEIDRKTIKILGGSIKTLGTYEAEAKLHREVTAKFSFEVIAE